MIVLTGVTEFRAALEAQYARQVAATRAATGRAAHMVERKAKDNLSTYAHERGEPTNSPPGDPPAVVSGTLRRSVHVDGPHALGGDRFEAKVGPSAIYGRIQELGGDTPHSTLPARPYLGPALNDQLPAIRALFRDAWRTAL